MSKKVAFCCHTLSIKTSLGDTSCDMLRHVFASCRQVSSKVRHWKSMKIHNFVKCAKSEVSGISEIVQIATLAKSEKKGSKFRAHFCTGKKVLFSKGEK